MEDPIADFLDWYKSRPLITKSFLTLSTLMAVLLSMGVFDIRHIYYQFDVAFNNL